MSNPERVGKALDLLRDGLRPACEQTWEGFFGASWLEVVNGRLHNPEPKPTTNDVAFLFKGMKATWNESFGHAFSPGVRSWVFELSDLRNDWAHQNPISSDDAVRGLDTMERVLGEFGGVEQRKAIQQLRKDLQRQVFDEETRSERRKTAAKPTEGQPQAGLTPWRDVIQPHQDVASGNFDQAEFAADLYEVHLGDAEPEYSEPGPFFARTYLTEGLRDLLMDATRRLSGAGGDPVIELQTNFGGGKTHSMIALYHLASGQAPSKMAGVGDALAEASVELPVGPISRAVLVGQMLPVAAPEPVEDGVLLHTMWGHMAYQLGGRDAYEIVRADDEAGTNPGAKLKTVFERCGPAVVLIDEWVAYARQLRDGGDGPRLAGGDFDTQFTFAQALTEAAAAARNVVVLVSIPASDIEVGGDRGKAALEKLKNVVTRKAKQWQPASPDESFEIVRRRLFDPIGPDAAKVRDGVIRAFCEMYRHAPGEFPSGCTEAEYERRMRLSYPIHPELFDRLFGEWSTLDKFQRTRGVLRLMATAIKHLWQRGDQSLLIMPGTLPMDSGELVSEMKKYLEEGWDPVIKSDVDGENALPLRIDSDNKHFGKISATRRAARTVYMGSAARPDGARGVDIKSVVLGCVQPGEPPTQFGDALKRLSGQATHLYVDGQQYWYSLQPNVTRVAADRAASNFSDRDADDLVEGRIREQGKGVFTGLHAFVEGPGDVPDEDDGVRLVVLTPNVTHQSNDAASTAIGLAAKIVAQRDSGPRLNQNMLVFVAATADRLGELRAAARLHLAWVSIVRDHEALDLTAHQRNQAETKITETGNQVDSLIAETFRLVLTPHRDPQVSADITWNTTRASESGALHERVVKKLASEEKLIQTYGGVRVRMDLDRFDLWSERHDISVRELWQAYARFPNFPRLISQRALLEAISDGTSKLAWDTESFAYADAHDGSKWVGISKGEMVSASPAGYLVHPDYVPAAEPPPGAEPSGEDGGAPQGEGRDLKHADGGPGVASDPEVTSFYALFELDPVRGIKQLGDIFEHVAARLGTDLELTLELRAKSEAGYDDGTRRIVSENASNLGAKAAEFE